jgi:hypothetical protein
VQQAEVSKVGIANPCHDGMDFRCQEKEVLLRSELQFSCWRGVSCSGGSRCSRVGLVEGEGKASGGKGGLYMIE